LIYVFESTRLGVNSITHLLNTSNNTIINNAIKNDTLFFSTFILYKTPFSGKKDNLMSLIDVQELVKILFLRAASTSSPVYPLTFVQVGDDKHILQISK
jgi:hypothetical protein